ncbi:Bacteriophage abortive infection AbiH [Acinetobacter marinus]|uniref:Bacteriophage abortive infection AbiH n=1 Tax=Acinetobacter marinus TaxID=281375 RepID=A0A1G6HDN7_9GAMM|nr:AbiH family protein [Acinetobacter marinus]SDB92427.1 Bacteriophage abortive infection AbiH [Acinetobacter marinus]
MNILIVGNGFDLSHYLPTKYDHFMDVMKAIDDFDTGKKAPDLSDHSVNEWMTLLDKTFEKRKDHDNSQYEMDFDSLYSKTRDANFISKTKEFYLTDQIILSSQDVVKLQYRLKLNNWYQYFKNHVEEINTWIDFEQKIEEVLNSLANCIVEIEKLENSSKYHEYFNLDRNGNLLKKELKTLGFFNFFALEEYSRRSIHLDGSSKLVKRNNINPIFCHGAKIEFGFNPTCFLGYLNNQLDEFIDIFDQYLLLVVNQLQPQTQLQISNEQWVYPDKIYSFNYTNTYQRIHNSTETEYLHGSCGENQNIVLGISDLEHECLRSLKAYGFTKYHQKLFKDTDYLFLDNYRNWINETDRNINILKESISSGYATEIRSRGERIRLRQTQETRSLNLTFYIWGHSLDVSDKDYIIDLFSLNNDIDRNVRIIVYFFNKPAKFALLNNLLRILGKDHVEKWMKKGWLMFASNPEIKTV